jgi:hypothetical protein
MVRCLSALDRFLSGVTPVLLLLAMASATISYFSGGAIPDVEAITGVMAGFATEALTWLQVRRTREAWAVYSRTPKDDPGRELVGRNLRVTAGVLALLAGFSFFNQLLFLGQSWHPSSTMIPVAWQWLVRAAVLPVLVLVSGVIAPLHEDPSAELARASASILRQCLRDVSDQVRNQIREAKERGDPLAPIATALLLDAQDPRGARRLRTIHEGLQETRGEVVPHHEAGNAPISLATHRSKKRKKAASDPEAQLGTVRRLLAGDPRMPLSQIMKRAHVSMSVASQLKKQIVAEMNETTDQQRVG